LNIAAAFLISGAVVPTVSTTPPVNPTYGQLYIDPTTNQLFLWNGTSYVLVGPQSSSPTSNNASFETIAGISVYRIILNGQTIGLWASAALPVGSLQNNPPPYNDVNNFPNGLDLGLNLPQNALLNGTAVSAEYADLAERYEIDDPENAITGTVVAIGGSKEITATKTDSDVNVFGVISSNPGLRMNHAAGSDASHPYIALAGRVPCRVNGKVEKGDRLVTSEIPGVARVVTAVELKKISHLAIFGRALEDKETTGLGLVKIVVGAK
jgi:hypothetical protein